MQYLKAFTFLELLIVVAIMITASGLVLATYNKANRTLTIEKDTQKITDVLGLARAKAASGDTSMCTAGPLVTPMVDYFSVSRVNPTTYLLSAVCPTGIPLSISYNTSESISLSNPFAIDFYKLSSGASQACFELTNGSECRYIQVSNQGSIEGGVTACGGSCP